MELNQLIVCLLSFSVHLNLASPVAEPTTLAVRDDWLGNELEETGKGTKFEIYFGSINQHFGQFWGLFIACRLAAEA